MFKWIKDKFKSDEEKEEKILEESQEDKELQEEDRKPEKNVEDASVPEESPHEELDSKPIKEEAFDSKELNQEPDLEEESPLNLEEDQEIKTEEELVQNEEDPIIKEEKDPDEEKEESKGFFKKLTSGLAKTRKQMGQKINQVLGAYVKVDDELLDDLEDILISSDMGMETTMEAIDRLKERIIKDEIKDPNLVYPTLKSVIQELLDECELDSTLTTTHPTIVLVVGVNGVGKTTTIGKLSSQLKTQGKTVLVAAADTFRAAAIDQLKTWGQRAGVDVISHSEGADPAAVTYDAVQAAKARDVDVLIVDTAGRLHNKSNLMKELEKIGKIIEREYPEANRENLLVLDATTGQNAIIQAKTFNEATNLTGFVLTKLDGTAKGGVVIGLQRELRVPIKFIGVGEQINDLQTFHSKDFVDALFQEES